MRPFIDNLDEFTQIRQRFAMVMHLDARLPAAVFRNTPVSCRCLEFEFVFTTDFWKALFEIATRIGDRTMLAMVVDPDPVDITAKHFGYYSALPISTTASPDVPLAALQYAPPSAEGDSFRIAGNTLAVISESGAVAAWAQCDVETIVVAVNQRAAAEHVDFPPRLPWMTGPEALDMMRPVFGGQPAPPDFRVQFLANYRCNDA